MRNFILILIMFVLMIGLGFFGLVIYNEFFSEEKVSTVNNENTMVGVDTEYRENAKKKSVGETIAEIFTPTEVEKVDYSPKSSQGKFYYEQLSDTQKTIYNGLQENKANLKKGNFKIEFGDAFSYLLSNEDGGKILGDDYQSAIEAFTHDNVDLYFLDISKMYLNIETKKRAFKTTYNVYISPEEGKNYYANGFTSEKDVLIAEQKIEEEKNIVKGKLTGDQYKDIKIIHDYLIDTIEYDKDANAIGTYSIYGAFIEKKCVCEGYAKAFKYLSDMAGIENVLIQGVATSSTGVSENHAWNAVNLKDIWYLVDVTWDDPIIYGTGIVLNSVHYKYFLKGSQTFAKDHTPEYTFTENGKIFSYPTISVTDY